MLNTQNKRIVPSSLEDIRPPRHHIPSYRPFHPPQPHPSTHQNPPNCEEAPPALILIQSVRSIINPLLLLIIRSSPPTIPPPTRSPLPHSPAQIHYDPSTFPPVLGPYGYFCRLCDRDRHGRRAVLPPCA